MVVVIYSVPSTIVQLNMYRGPPIALDSCMTLRITHFTLIIQLQAAYFLTLRNTILQVHLEVSFYTFFIQHRYVGFKFLSSFDEFALGSGTRSRSKPNLKFLSVGHWTTLLLNSFENDFYSCRKRRFL